MLLHRSKGENAYHKKERVCPLNRVIQTILKIHSLSIFYSRLVAVVRKEMRLERRGTNRGFPKDFVSRVEKKYKDCSICNVY